MRGGTGIVVKEPVVRRLEHGDVPQMVLRARKLQFLIPRQVPQIEKRKLPEIIQMMKAQYAFNAQ